MDIVTEYTPSMIAESIIQGVFIAAVFVSIVLLAVKLRDLADSKKNPVGREFAQNRSRLMQDRAVSAPKVSKRRKRK